LTVSDDVTLSNLVTSSDGGTLSDGVTLSDFVTLSDCGTLSDGVILSDDVAFSGLIIVTTSPYYNHIASNDIRW
jgi:hypothetical protein